MTSSSASVDQIVIDASPLIALARLNLLKLPSSMFARALITDVVAAECLSNPRYTEHPTIQFALDDGLLTRQEWTDSQSCDMWNLDQGEAGTIDVALRLKGVVLMDDLAARRVASSLQVPTLGTCGLLLLAKRKDLVGDLKPLLGQLIDSGYYLGEKLVERVLRMAGEN